MKKLIGVLTFLFFITTLKSQEMKTIHDFKVHSIAGNEIDFSIYKGKKLMVVNTASKCGFTPQYEKLQELYEKYKEKGLVVIGFPANNFLNQEPGTNEQIKEFCSVNYGVTFPMMEKISVKGKKIHPLYQWLTKKEENGVSGAKVKWNFHKFLIDENGNWVASVSPKTKPNDETIITWIETGEYK